jgi:hypothetical protein
MADETFSAKLTAAVVRCGRPKPRTAFLDEKKKWQTRVLVRDFLGTVLNLLILGMKTVSFEKQRNVV